MFSENLEALYELQIAVQEFTDSYVYIKGYNKSTVERIQHMYMKAYRVSRFGANGYRILLIHTHMCSL